MRGAAVFGRRDAETQRKGGEGSGDSRRAPRISWIIALLAAATVSAADRISGGNGTLIAGGVLAMLMFQVFVNAGMTIGIMPITGVPLPLMSYGGSSVLVTFIAIGLLQSIYIQARMTAASKTRGLVS